MSEMTGLGGQEVIGVNRGWPDPRHRRRVNVGYDEVVEVTDSAGKLRRGRVLKWVKRLPWWKFSHHRVDGGGHQRALPRGRCISR